MKAAQNAAALLSDRSAFPDGHPEWTWRTKAAWILDQMARGIPSCNWVDQWPDDFGKSNEGKE